MEIILIRIFNNLINSNEFFLKSSIKKSKESNILKLDTLNQEYQISKIDILKSLISYLNGSEDESSFLLTDDYSFVDYRSNEIDSHNRFGKRPPYLHEYFNSITSRKRKSFKFNAERDIFNMMNNQLSEIKYISNSNQTSNLNQQNNKGKKRVSVDLNTKIIKSSGNKFRDKRANSLGPRALQEHLDHLEILSNHLSKRDKSIVSPLLSTWTMNLAGENENNNPFMVHSRGSLYKKLSNNNNTICIKSSDYFSNNSLNEITENSEIKEIKEKEENDYDNCSAAEVRKDTK